MGKLSFGILQRRKFQFSILSCVIYFPFPRFSLCETILIVCLSNGNTFCKLLLLQSLSSFCNSCSESQLNVNFIRCYFRICQLVSRVIFSFNV